MPRGLPDFSATEAIGVASVGLAAFTAVYFGMRAMAKKRPSPEEFEAHRRQWLATYGKLGGGQVIEVNENNISYEYDVRGINYTASQDLSVLLNRLPEDRWSIIGAVGVRYDPRNPANSIVLSESWSGLRHSR